MNEDSGGDAELDMDIQEALTALDALHTYDPAVSVVVPREPTEKMIEAAFVYTDVGNGVMFAFASKNPRDMYKAMISAAEGE